ncbi:MAG: hydroxyacid dehydrogenase [Candidatus Hodarchaeaceae archaeon]|nr:hydroxyacid dehydrogenase [Candidatus Hodarchaeaceae archaeon]
MTRILITDPIHEDGIRLLKEVGRVNVKTGMTNKQLLREIGSYDVLVVRSATKVSKEVIEAGKKLRMIARAGVGLDNIDVEAAERRNIKVVNSPEALTIAVAELTLGLMLSLARQIPSADFSTKRGRWEKAKFMGMELRDKTLGIVGTGRIGRAVGYKAKAFLMNLLAYDVAPNKEFKEKTGCKYVDLQTLLRGSDFVTLHVALTSQTRHMISKRELGLMKPTAFLINTSRGEVVDEAALVEALRGKRIAGAALDVYEKEPPLSSPLLKLDNVILTPHIGASTIEAQREASVIVARKIKESFGLMIYSLPRE